MRKYEISPYYPPRARWYSPLRRIGDGFRRLTWLDRIHLPDAMSPWAFMAALVIPGLAFKVRRERLIAWGVFAAYLLLAVIFLIWLGHTAANLAFGLMLSLHVTSILFLCNPWLARARFVFRILFGMGLLVVVGGLLYAPIRNQIQGRWLMPLRLNGAVVVVQTFSPASSVQRGDWIAYRIEDISGPGLHMTDSLGLRPVLGLPGDHLRFTPTHCEVNGVLTPRLAQMPSEGEVIVPENHWFIWPEFAMTLQGNAAPTAAAAFLRMSDVDQTTLVGTPFKRWFWRRQPLP